MTRTTLGIAALGAFCLLASSHLPGATADARRDTRKNRYQLEAERYKAAYEELAAGLDRVERLNQRRATRRTQRRIQRTIEGARERAHALVDPRYTEPTYVEIAPEPIDHQRFDAMRTAVADASFAREQTRIVSEIAEHHWFTVAQVVTLMGEVSFASTKIDVAAALYPRVVDHQDWYQVYAALDFDSSRAKLRARVKRIKLHTPRN